MATKAVQAAFETFTACATVTGASLTLVEAATMRILGICVTLSSVVTATGPLDVPYRATLSLSALTIAGVAERRAY